MNDFEKRWQRISQLLAMEATGKERPMFSSGRTLFGIKSSVEEKMDQFAREIEEEQAAKRKATHAVAQKDATAKKDADSADDTLDSATKSSSNHSLESGYSPNKPVGTGADKAHRASCRKHCRISLCCKQCLHSIFGARINGACFKAGHTRCQRKT